VSVDALMLPPAPPLDVDPLVAGPGLPKHPGGMATSWPEQSPPPEPPEQPELSVLEVLLLESSEPAFSDSPPQAATNSATSSPGTRLSRNLVPAVPVSAGGCWIAGNFLMSGPFARPMPLAPSRWQRSLTVAAFESRSEPRTRGTFLTGHRAGRAGLAEVFGSNIHARRWATCRSLIARSVVAFREKGGTFSVP